MGANQVEHRMRERRSEPLACGSAGGAWLTPGWQRAGRTPAPKGPKNEPAGRERRARSARRGNAAIGRITTFAERI